MPDRKSMDADGHVGLVYFSNTVAPKSSGTN